MISTITHQLVPPTKKLVALSPTPPPLPFFCTTSSKEGRGRCIHKGAFHISHCIPIHTVLFQQMANNHHKFVQEDKHKKQPKQDQHETRRN